jgi:hypothetical protein
MQRSSARWSRLIDLADARRGMQSESVVAGQAPVADTVPGHGASGMT